MRRTFNALSAYESFTKGLTVPYESSEYMEYCDGVVTAVNVVMFVTVPGVVAGYATGVSI